MADENGKQASLTKKLAGGVATNVSRARRRISSFIGFSEFALMIFTANVSLTSNRVDEQPMTRDFRRGSETPPATLRRKPALSRPTSRSSLLGRFSTPMKTLRVRRSMLVHVGDEIEASPESEPRSSKETAPSPSSGSTPTASSPPAPAPTVSITIPSTSLRHLIHSHNRGLVRSHSNEDPFVDPLNTVGMFASARPQPDETPIARADRLSAPYIGDIGSVLNRSHWWKPNPRAHLSRCPTKTVGGSSHPHREGKRYGDLKPDLKLDAVSQEDRGYDACSDSSYKDCDDRRSSSDCSLFSNRIPNYSRKISSASNTCESYLTRKLKELKSTSTGHVNHITGEWRSNDPFHAAASSLAHYRLDSMSPSDGVDLANLSEPILLRRPKPSSLEKLQPSSCIGKQPTFHKGRFDENLNSNRISCKSTPTLPFGESVSSMVSIEEKTSFLQRPPSSLSSFRIDFGSSSPQKLNLRGGNDLSERVQAVYLTENHDSLTPDEFDSCESGTVGSASSVRHPSLRRVVGRPYPQVQCSSRFPSSGSRDLKSPTGPMSAARSNERPAKWTHGLRAFSMENIPPRDLRQDNHSRGLLKIKKTLGIRMWKDYRRGSGIAA